jgi:arylsulfatase A-like enzyme
MHAAPLLLAGLLLSGAETVRAVRLGWDHPIGYFALCALFTLVYSAGVGVACGLLCALSRWAVPLWVASVFAVIESGRDGAIALVLHLALRRLVGTERLGARMEALVGAGAVVWTLLLLPSLAEKAGAAAERLATVSPGIALGFTAAFSALTGVANVLRASRAQARVALLAILVVSAAIPSIATPGRDHRRAASASGGTITHRPSIVVIVLDTVGVRHLSLYGYERRTTPKLEEFLQSRANARTYPAAFSTSPWTVPAHVSLLTGLIPSDHGAHYPEDGSSPHRFSFRAAVTVPELLRYVGYRTMAVFANRLDLIGGFSRGFDVFYQPRFPERLPLLGEKIRRRGASGIYAEARKPYPEAKRVTLEALRQLEECGAQPCFLLVNYLDAHNPYIPDPACRGRFGPRWDLFEDVEGPSVQDSAERLQHLSARHDEEICGLDREIAFFLNRLFQRRMLDRAWVIVTSDHGESFGQHGTTEHGSSVYNEQVQIPLIVFPPPEVRLPSVDAPVSLIDVTATICDIAGLQPIGEGRSLLERSREHRAPIEFFGNRSEAAEKGRLAGVPASAVVSGRYKLIRMEGKLLLFDLVTDPLEERDLASQSEEQLDTMAPLLPPLRARTGPLQHPAADLSERDRDALRELGYLE